MADSPHNLSLKLDGSKHANKEKCVIVDMLNFSEKIDLFNIYGRTLNSLSEVKLLLLEVLCY